MPGLAASSPANKSLRGSRAPEAGVRGLASPFINLDEKGRETPHTSLLPLLLKRKDFLDEVLERCGYQTPVLGIVVQGSAAGNAPPFCSSSIDMPSGERTKAMRPSRGGRLIVTP